MFGFDEHHDQVYGEKADKASWTHEMIAGAAAFEAMKSVERGSTDKHKLTKEMFAAFAGAEADKLFETKGLDFLDREKAKAQAQQNAERIYDENPKLTLYSSPVCPYAARAVLAMAETSQAHEAISIDINVPRPDWYLHINPYGQVPALKINDKDVIYESLIVAEYIAELHPESGLLSTDALQRAQSRYLIQHWGSHVQSVIHKAAVTLDPVESAKLRQDVIRELEKVNGLLEKVSHKVTEVRGPFFLGDKFTFADLAIAPFLARFFLITAFQQDGDNVSKEFEHSLQENKNLKRFNEWRHAVVSRASVKKATADPEAIKNLYRKFIPKTN
ncbi:hypothetical protein BGX28_000353 [Mortierella sp. GBA30]|nr:hypothetical protein BGX28_000353 [Mortierella sp. GBA30]